MNVTDAAEQVLRQASEPLTVPEITKRILGKGLWTTSGKTPEATVGARLGSEIKHKQEKSRFVRTAPNTYAINDGSRPLVPTKKTKSKRASVSESATRQAKATADRAPKPTMTYLDAAEKILSEHSGGNPMHYQAITKLALDLGLISTQGLTPWATMNAQLVTNINQAKTSGGETLFTKPKRGYYGLTAWEDSSISSAIAHHNQHIREQLHQRLHDMEPAVFEELVGQVLVEMGFSEIEVTKLQGDGGIDVRGTLIVAGSFPVKMAVQVKRWKNNVGSPDVQKVRGAATADERPLLITTSGFSKGARNEAQKFGAVPVGLMGGDEFVSLMIEHGIGVRRTSHAIIEFEDENIQEELQI